jgi:pyruvate kinase
MTIDTQIDLLKKRRTKIIATLGPASEDVKTITRLLQAGVNVFRLNMSHSNHDTHAALIANIRTSMKETGIVAAIMADLCGPKIRTGIFEDDRAELKRGTELVVTTRKVKGNASLIPSQYRQLHEDVETGQKILLNDGLITLEVLSVCGTEVSCRVVHGGIISNHKGINLPDSAVSAPAMTGKDRKDAIFALQRGVDYLSLSFVRCADEIHKLRRLIKRENSQAGIIAKIETPPALANIEEILQASDAIMVARGDLGVELKPEEVPVAQLQLIDRARAANRPVIVATQVLESMIEQARPTRAEISDISYAVSSGTDALMLSAESSVGKHPVSAIRMMDRAIRYTESYRWRHGVFGTFGLDISENVPLNFGHAISIATSQLSKDLLVRAIVVISNSGVSAVTVSAARPSAPIIGITDREDVSKKMRLMWGIIPCLVKPKKIRDASQLARQKAVAFGLAKNGDYILLVQGFHRNKRENVPSVSVLQV